MTSDIIGTGYGDCHTWKKIGTAQFNYSNYYPEPYEKFTKYRCLNCNVYFSHYYDLERNIFKAMERSSKVPNFCSKKSSL